MWKQISAPETLTFTCFAAGTRVPIYPLTNVPTIEHTHEDIDIHVQIAPGNSPISKNVHRDEHWAERSLIRIKRVADFEVSTKNRNPCLLQRIFSPVSLNNTYWRGRKRAECGFARNPPA